MKKGRAKYLARGALLMAALAGGLLQIGGARADLAPCRADPIVTLSNGTQLTMYADVYDNVNDILVVTFELHIPKNVWVTNVQYDPTYGALETVTVINDQQPGNYHTYTTAYTGLPVAEDSFVAVSGPVCQNKQTSTMANTTPHMLPNQFNC